MQKRYPTFSRGVWWKIHGIPFSLSAMPIQNLRLVSYATRRREAKFNSIRMRPGNGPVQFESIPIQRTRFAGNTRCLCKKGFTKENRVGAWRSAGCRMDARNSQRANCRMQKSFVPNRASNWNCDQWRCELFPGTLIHCGSGRTASSAGWKVHGRTSFVCRKRNVLTINFLSSRSRRLAITRPITERNRIMASRFSPKASMHDVRASLCDEVVDPQARIIAASIDNVRIFSIYAPNGQAVGSPAYEYKLNWYRRLRDCVAKEKRRDLIVCGDFNVAPEDVDVYDPDLWRGAIMCSDGEREAFHELCEIGLRDTLRIHHNGGGMFSWWDYRMLAFAKNRGLRIDAVLASEALAKNALTRESTGKCAREKNLPITLRFGQNSRIRRIREAPISFTCCKSANQTAPDLGR